VQRSERRAAAALVNNFALKTALRLKNFDFANENLIFVV
jgi:hypothetical protein